MSTLSARAQLIAAAAGRWAVELDTECTVTATVAAEILVDRHATQFEHLARRWRDATEAGLDPAETLGYAAASGRWAWTPPTTPSPPPAADDEVLDTTTTGPGLDDVADEVPGLPTEFRIPADDCARGLERVAALRARIAASATREDLGTGPEQ